MCLKHYDANFAFWRYFSERRAASRNLDSHFWFGAWSLSTEVSIKIREGWDWVMSYVFIDGNNRIAPFYFVTILFSLFTSKGDTSAYAGFPLNGCLNICNECGWKRL